MKYEITAKPRGELKIVKDMIVLMHKPKKNLQNGLLIHSRDNGQDRFSTLDILEGIKAYELPNDNRTITEIYIKQI